MSQITQYKKFKAELAVAETFEELRTIEAKADALAEFASKEKIGKELQNEWGKFRVEIKAKKGAWLEDKFPKGVRADRRVAPTATVEMPVTEHESSNARLIFNEPGLVNDAINKIIDDDKVVTPSSVATEVRKMLIEIQPSNSTFNSTNDNIEWAKWSWNPMTGCKHGCKYCYARDIAERFYPQGFEPTFHENRLIAPMATKQPIINSIGDKNVFVCSMDDLFGEWVPDEWIEKVLDACRKSPQWNYLFLTKNPGRYIGIEWPDTAWVGTTVDVKTRMPIAQEMFRQIRARVRFLSCEPLNEDMGDYDLSMFNWVIIGGQSRSSRMEARQPDLAWVQRLINNARHSGCKVYSKPNLKVGPPEIRTLKEYPCHEEQSPIANFISPCYSRPKPARTTTP